MLLVVDVGNTQTVVGVYTPIDAPTTAADGLLGPWRLVTVPDRTEDELAVVIAGLLQQVDVDWQKDVSGVSICSGVPKATTALRRLVNRYLAVDPVVLGPGTRSGIAIHYDNPKEVGADRIANAVGAFNLYGGPSVVVDFGTATTLDALSAAGEYLGGAIAPGLEISLDALFERAAGLRAVELVEPRSVIGRTTAESLQSGTLYGYASMVDGLCRRFVEALGGTASVVATGGLAPLIAPYTDTIAEVEPWITLHGLRLVHAMNAS